MSFQEEPMDSHQEWLQNNSTSIQAANTANNVALDIVKDMAVEELNDAVKTLKFVIKARQEQYDNAEEALIEPKKKIARMNEDILTMKSQLNSHKEKAEHGTIDERVQSRMYVNVLQEQISVDESRRNQAEQNLQPLEQELTEARNLLGQAEDKALEYALSTVDPWGLHGRLTYSFKFFVLYGGLIPVLIGDDRDHPLWDVAVEWVKDLAASTDRGPAVMTPKDGERIRTDNYTPEGAPNARSVIALEQSRLDYEYGVKDVPVPGKVDYTHAYPRDPHEGIKAPRDVMNAAARTARYRIDPHPQ